MRRYSDRRIQELATELCAGLVRLRKGYVDGAEALLKISEPDREYPFDFVVYRLTGYRPPTPPVPERPIGGHSLRGDLLKIMMDVCESFDLPTASYDEPVFDTPALARRFKVSTKTLQRWRRDGLPARRLLFADGRRRVGYLQSSVDWFEQDQRLRVQRSMKFSQMSPLQRQDIIRRARRMAGFTNCSLSEIARRLSARTGRAAETIRYTIRRHDRRHLEHAVFMQYAPPLSEQQKLVIYRCFLQGVSASALAGQHDRTRGSIYRVVAEMRTRQLLHRDVEYVYNPQFDLPGADEAILGSDDGVDVAAAAGGAPALAGSSQDVATYLRQLYDVPLLEANRERDMFRRYNYLKYKADRLRRQININRVRTAQLRHIESLLIRANAVQNAIIRANLRLVVSIAKKHMGGPQTLLELISDGNVSLMRAVEKFDYSRGYRFSTYASWAIMRNFARSVPKERFQIDRFSTPGDGLLDIASGLRSGDGDAVKLSDLRESVKTMLSHLTPRERMILVSHYGLDEQTAPQTFDQLGQKLGISKERVRQIEMKALEKLRTVARPQEADFQER